MVIKIQLEVVKGDAALKMESEDISVADLQAAVSNIELLKMNLLTQLAGMTEVHKGEDKND